MASDEAVIGCTGVLLLGTRGRETFLAWSEEPLPKGAPVLVINSRGSRQVEVIEWADPLEALSGEPDNAG